MRLTSSVGAAVEGELDEADAAVLGDQRQHDQPAVAALAQEADLGRVGGRVGDVDRGHDLLLHDAPGERVRAQVVRLVHGLADRRRVAAEGPDAVGRVGVPGADLGLAGADGPGEVLGHQVRDGDRVEGARERAAHVQQLAQVRGEAAGLGEVRGAREGRRGLVGEDQQEAQVLLVELAQAELGQRDDADQRVVVEHRHDEHRLVDLVRARDRRAARVGVRVVDAERGPVLRDPAGEPLAELRPQDRHVDALVRADPALEGDGHEHVRGLEQVDAGVVVVDDPAGLLDDGAADLLGLEARAHPPGGELEDRELGGPSQLRRAGPADEGAGAQERAADRQVEDEDDLLDRTGAAVDHPAGEAEDQEQHPAHEREGVQAPRRRSPAPMRGEPIRGHTPALHWTMLPPRGVHRHQPKVPGVRRQSG